MIENQTFQWKSNNMRNLFICLNFEKHNMIEN